LTPLKEFRPERCLGLRPILIDFVGALAEVNCRTGHVSWENGHDEHLRRRLRGGYDNSGD